MALDIRTKMDKVLEKYGYTVIYVRTDQRFRCSCYSERSGESSDPNCPLCFGTAYKCTVEQVLTRRTTLTMPETKVAVRKDGDVGTTVVSGYTYYVGSYFKAKTGDYIFEVEWKHGKPLRIKEKFKISIVEEKEGLHGRTEFYEIFARTHWVSGGDVNAIE